jgi:hypothetical protein
MGAETSLRSDRRRPGWSLINDQGWAANIDHLARTRDVRPACGVTVGATGPPCAPGGASPCRRVSNSHGCCIGSWAARMGRGRRERGRTVRPSCALPRSGRDARPPRPGARRAGMRLAIVHGERGFDDAGVLYAGRWSAREDNRRSDGPQEQVRGGDGSAAAAIARRGCAVPSDRISKQQTIRTLSPQIFALRSKGYSWTAVAAMLSERGVPVSVAALRTYLRRVREEAVDEEQHRPPTKRSRDARLGTRQPERPPPIAPPPSPNGEKPPPGKPRQPVAAAASAVAAQQATVLGTQREQDPRRTTSALRPDRDVV